MHLIKPISFLFLCFLMSILLSACGSKGDLYQAEDPKSEQTSATTAPQEPKKKQP